MKKISIGFIIGIFLLSLFSFKIISYEPRNNTAEVEQIQGVNVFIGSRPVKEYEFLGNVKSGGVVMSKDYEDLMPKMVKKAVEKYPKADGVIFKGGSIYECDAIRFK
jgi:hypothetical protein